VVRNEKAEAPGIFIWLCEVLGAFASSPATASLATVRRSGCVLREISPDSLAV